MNENPIYDNAIASGCEHAVAVEHVITAIRGQYGLWPRTAGVCSTDGCEEYAFGGGRCRLCITQELGRVTGDMKAALDFTDHTRAANSLAAKLIRND